MPLAPVTVSVAAVFEQFLFAHKDMNHLALKKSSKIAILADMGDRSHDLIKLSSEIPDITAVCFRTRPPH